MAKWCAGPKWCCKESWGTGTSASGTINRKGTHDVIQSLGIVGAAV